MSERSTEKDAPRYQPCCAECNGCPTCDPGLSAKGGPDA